MPFETDDSTILKVKVNDEFIEVEVLPTMLEIYTDEEGFTRMKINKEELR